jgi:hypothetical protein
VTEKVRDPKRMAELEEVVREQCKDAVKLAEQIVEMAWKEHDSGSTHPSQIFLALAMALRDWMGTIRPRPGGKFPEEFEQLKKALETCIGKSILALRPPA